MYEDKYLGKIVRTHNGFIGKVVSFNNVTELYEIIDASDSCSRGWFPSDQFTLLSTIKSKSLDERILKLELCIARLKLQATPEFKTVIEAKRALKAFQSKETTK